MRLVDEIVAKEIEQYRIRKRHLAEYSENVHTMTLGWAVQADRHH